MARGVADGAEGGTRLDGVERNTLRRSSSVWLDPRAAAYEADLEPVLCIGGELFDLILPDRASKLTILIHRAARSSILARGSGFTSSRRNKEMHGKPIGESLLLMA
jgi:hypothetical protein